MHDQELEERGYFPECEGAASARLHNQWEGYWEYVEQCEIDGIPVDTTKAPDYVAPTIDQIEDTILDSLFSNDTH